MIINLTPHVVNVLSASGKLLAAFPADGTVARVSVTRVQAGELAGLPVFRSEFGAVVGLPEPTPGVAFVVSALVRLALPGRRDLYSPGELVRDAVGLPVGCRGLEGQP